MKKKQLMGNALLLLTAFIWGVAFVAQSKGMDHVGPLTFNGARSLLAAVVLLPLAWVLRRRSAHAAPPLDKRAQLLGGLVCGLLLFCASTLQQVALVTTDAGKAGFLTALYIVLVPVFGVFLRKKAPVAVWGAVALATVGLYLLCGVGSGAGFAPGDLCLLGCAVCFAGQIMAVDRFAPRTDPILLSGTQFLVVGLLSLPAMFIWEQPSLSGLQAALLPLLYTGVLSSAVAYTLQIVGQRSTQPAVASLLMSFESVFSVLAGALLLRERLSPAEGWGCALVFVAILLAQLPAPAKQHKQKTAG